MIKIYLEIESNPPKGVFQTVWKPIDQPFYGVYKIGKKFEVSSI